jgi:excisionase family DNA binding protein
MAGERSVLIDQAAQALGVSRRTIYYRIREGKLKTIRAKCGSQRVLWSSIEALKAMKAVNGGKAEGGLRATLQAEALTFEV